MQAWEEFLQKQETELGFETVKKWLRSLKVLRFDACNLYLEAKDSFQLLWFDEHIKSIAQTTLVNGNNRQIKIHISIANTPTALPKTRGKGKFFQDSEKPFQLTFDELDPNCQFNYFVSSEENKLPLKLLNEISGSLSNNKLPLDSFNPIYIHGSSGSGKTHLLMSLAQIYRSRGLKTVYARAETFTDHVVTAIRAGQMSMFRQAYRTADILLIDDVHVFSRKGATQEEFFHTFNTLHLDNKQIILTSNCSPQELTLIEPRLVSRFEWGIVLPLKLLETTEELSKLLKTKSDALKFHLPSKISDFLIETFPSNPKNLVKAFEALVLRLHLGQEHSIQGLTLPAVKALLADLIDDEQKHVLTPIKIVQTVADHFEIRYEDILSKAQTKECVLPRQIAMCLCRNKLKIPFMKIGEIFSRDHSTVMASVKHVQKALDENMTSITNIWYPLLKKLESQ